MRSNTLANIVRVNPHAIIVTYSAGVFEHRRPVSIEFQDEYADALRVALQAIREGKRNVTLIQHRETLHTHSELQQAVSSLNPFSTDEEIVEEVHYCSQSGYRVHRQHFMDYILPHIPSPLVWASF